MSVRRTLRRRAGTVLLLVTALLAGTYLVARAIAQPAAPHPWFAPRPGEHRPLVIAHRGGAGLRPANSMPALRHAVELGADVLDVDLRMTRDGALVLFHDPILDRTTNGSGAIRDRTLAEVRRLDAAYHFTTDGGRTHPYRGQGVTVPTLEEVFSAFPQQRFGIEIKGNDPLLARQLCALVRRHGMQDKVLASSFVQESMDGFRRECPEVATSATAREARVFLLLHTLGLVELLSPGYQSLQVPARFRNHDALTPEFIASAQRRGLPVLVWTLNDESDFRRALAAGVDGINTDHPERLLRLLKDARWQNY